MTDETTIIRHPKPQVAISEREVLIAKLRAAKPRSHGAVILRNRLRTVTHQALARQVYEGAR